MPFQVGNGCFPSAISDSRITSTVRSDTPPEISVWGKIRAFFCSRNKPEALEVIQRICHPPTRTTWQEVAGRFERLRTLAYDGYEENFQSGRYGENHFCILDENSREILSVTLDEVGKYTVKCQGHDKTHDLNPDTEHGEDYAEQAEGASGTLPTPTTTPDYEAVWYAWERAGPTEEAKDRAQVVKILRQIQNSNAISMNLYDLNISSLSYDLPSYNRQFPNSNPDCLSMCDLNISSLPDHLPPRIRHIEIRNIPLTSLPALPDGLWRLKVDTTPLTSLPMLPERIKNLGVYNTPLTSLPTLPDGLCWMNITGTSLTELPALPDGLGMLFIRNAPLTSLPEVPASLTRMMVNNTSVTSLPESLTGLSSNASVDISNNPLSRRTRQALEAMTSAPDYSGPAIHFSMSDPSVSLEARPLHLAVAEWLMPAKEGESAPEDRWLPFGEEHDADSFSAFLDRLSETLNFKKDVGFKAQTGSWLTQLAEDDELRTKTFAMAREATSSCEDRVTLALNQMKNVQLVHNAEKGKYDNNLPELVTAGREMFRLEKLEQIARDKVKALKFVDEIVVYLGYQNKLKESLGLTSVTKEMFFFGVSHITESDLQAAEVQVKTAENSQFREWILQWSPLRSVLERAYPKDWEMLNEKKISDYDDAYRKLSDTELKPAGLVGNTDAERSIGARALESAEKAFLDGFSPLANKMLDGHLKARWP